MCHNQCYICNINPDTNFYETTIRLERILPVQSICDNWN